MRTLRQSSEDYKRIESAIRYIETNFKAQPDLEQIARAAHLSKFHFERLFKRWAGISAKQFLQFITLEYTKSKLEQSTSLLETSFEAGLSGPSRLHDLFVTFDAMTPGEFKKHGAEIEISYGFGPSPFGECLVATTDRGICFLGFVSGRQKSATLYELLKTWPGAVFIENPGSAQSLIKKVFELKQQGASQPFNLLIKGTNFQIKVWQALLNIPEGYLSSYQDIAAHIGHPNAYRAVANTIAVNPVAYLIPCHRVITKVGQIHKYRWDSVRKKALVGWEAANNPCG